MHFCASVKLISDCIVKIKKILFCSHSLYDFATPQALFYIINTYQSRFVHRLKTLQNILWTFKQFKVMYSVSSANITFYWITNFNFVVGNEIQCCVYSKYQYIYEDFFSILMIHYKEILESNQITMNNK